jgi:hypothetical protein
MSQFTGSKTMTMQYKADAAGLPLASPQCAFREAYSGNGALLSSGYGSTLSSWTVESFAVSTGLTSGSGLYNQMEVFPGQCGAGSFIDSLDVNWIKLVAQ